MDEVLGEPANRRVPVIKSSNQLCVSCQISILPPFQVAKENVKWVALRHFTIFHKHSTAIFGECRPLARKTAA